MISPPWVNKLANYEFTEPEDNSFESIGKLKIETHAVLPRNKIEFSTVVGDRIGDINYKVSPARMHPIKNKFDTDEINALIDSVQSLMLKAKYAGCGKTTAAKNYIKARNLNGIEFSLDFFLGFRWQLTFVLVGAKP